MGREMEKEFLAKHFETPHLYITDNDIEVLPNGLALLVKVAENHENFGAVASVPFLYEVWPTGMSERLEIKGSKLIRRPLTANELEAEKRRRWEKLQKRHEEWPTKSCEKRGVLELLSKFCNHFRLKAGKLVSPRSIGHLHELTKKEPYYLLDLLGSNGFKIVRTAEKSIIYICVIKTG